MSQSGESYLQARRVIVGSDGVLDSPDRSSFMVDVTARSRNDGPDEPELLSAYLVEARSALIRSQSRSDELLTAARGGDQTAQGLLVEGYLDLASSLALALRPDGLSELRAIQEANMALIEVIDGESTDIPSALRVQIGQRFSRREAPMPAERGPDSEEGDQAAPSAGHELDLFTGNARAAVANAQEEARELDHHYVGTEHLLLGLLGDADGLPATVLRGNGIELEKVRSAIVALIGRGNAPSNGPLPYTPRARNVLEVAPRLARDMQSNYVAPQHLLLALVAEADAVAVQILRGADGRTPDWIREAVLAAFPDGTTGGG